MQNVVLDVVGMVLNTKGQQFKDQTQQLNGTGVFALRLVIYCVS